MCLCGLADWRETFFVAVLLTVAAHGNLDGAEEPVAATVLENLKRPCGVAVRPGGTADRYEVFIAESGAGRVARWANLAPERLADAITGFASNTAANPLDQTGPRALCFLDAGLMVVGTTSGNSGGVLRAYELPEGEAVLRAEQSVEPAGDRANADDAAAGPTCQAITRSRANEFVPDILVAVVFGNDGKAHLRKSRVQADILGTLQPFGPSELSTAPRAAATSNSGRIVIGDAGGRLTFYNPIDGTVELVLATELKNPAALAYCPTSGSLYAADFAGGIYRIDDAGKPGRPENRTVKVADVSKPTAFAFAPDGALYVVTFGDGDEDGTLEVITGEM